MSEKLQQSFMESIKDLEKYQFNVIDQTLINDMNVEEQLPCNKCDGDCCGVVPFKYKQVLDILNNSNTKTVISATPINVVDNTKSNATPTGPQSAEEDLLKAMSLLNTYNKEAPDGTLGKEEIKPRTDVEEQTGRNVDGNIVVDNPEALKKWNELSKDTRDLLKLMNMNETNWNNMLPKQRESELNCLS